MLDKTIYKQIFKASFDAPIDVEFWDGEQVNYGDGEPIAKIKLNEIIPIKDIMAHASLTFGEAYMDGKIEINGDLQQLVTTVYEAKDSFMNNSKFSKLIPKRSHSEKVSKEDVQSHYDIGNDFYQMWLDPTMTYSCAYFASETDSLEDAQWNKVHHILNKLHAKPNETLLDIGCGWGTLIFTAAKEYNLEATGVTLSQEQYDFVKAKIKSEGLEGRVHVFLKDYREIKQTYNHVTSVGMFEHVGKENLQEYFEQVNNRLADDGTALIHGITGQHDGAGVDAWINKYIFQVVIFQILQRISVTFSIPHSNWMMLSRFVVTIKRRLRCGQQISMMSNPQWLMHMANVSIGCGICICKPVPPHLSLVTSMLCNTYSQKVHLVKIYQ